MSRIDPTLKADHANVTEKMAEQHDQLTRVESGLHTLDRRLNQEQRAADKRLECIGEAVDQSKSAVFSPRPLSNQIATPVR